MSLFAAILLSQVSRIEKASAHDDDSLLSLAALSLLPSTAGVEVRSNATRALIGWELQIAGKEFLNPNARHRFLVSPLVALYPLKGRARFGYRYVHSVAKRTALAGGFGVGIFDGVYFDAEAAIRLEGRVFWWLCARPLLSLEDGASFGLAATVGWSFY